MARLIRFCVSLFAVLLLMASCWTGHAQFNASLTGTVQDQTQAAIPSATVTLINNGTQAKKTVVSGDSGTFTFSELPPGNYTLQVAAKGFAENTISNVAVVAETPRNLDVTLSAGQETQTVNVDANTLPVLQTSDANVSRTLSSEEIERLPVFGADPYELLRTAPGITGDGARSGAGQAVFLPNNVGAGGSNSGIYQTENQPQISADGQRVADNNLTIDGVSVNSLTHGGSAVVTPNEESVAGITVTAISFDASDGRNTGAQIKTTTKSGTNQVHGSLFFLYNEPGLDAYNRYGGPIAGELPVRVGIKQRTYAASIGGPILKNKLFLFGSFQGFGQGNNTVENNYVDTAQFRASVIAGRPGGLSASTLDNPLVAPRIRTLVASDCSLYANNPSTYIPTKVNGTGPVVTQTAQSGPYCQVVNGGLDIGSLTPGGASQLGVYLPYSNTGTAAAPGPATGVGGAFVGGGLDGIADVTQAQLFLPGHSRGNQFNGRVDYHATSKDLIAGSLFITKLDKPDEHGPDLAPHWCDVPFKPLNSAVTLIYIHTFSSSWINELRSNGTRFADDGPADFGSINLGIPYTYIQNTPLNSIDYGVQGGNTTAAILAQNTIEVGDQATHTFGSHSLKFGGGFRWEQDNDNLDGGVRPDFAFAGPWNLANDAPLFESQTVNPVNGLAPATAAHFRSQTFYTYIQHDWKVTPTFSFNAGFRYEIQTPWHRKAGAPSYLPAPGTGAGGPLIGLTLQPVGDLYNTDYGHYLPKIAFAWNPKNNDGHFVIRGGFAAAYNHLDLSLFENTVQNGPGVLSYGVCCGQKYIGRRYAVRWRSHQVRPWQRDQPEQLSPPILHSPRASTRRDSPNALPGPNQSAPTVGLYGVGTTIRNPLSYLYSLDTETLLPGNLTLTVGYAGSLGRHYARLVNQNFLYPTSVTTGGVTTATSAGSDFLAQTDSSQAYNSLNVRVVKQVHHGLQFDGTYTYAKGMDNITNGDQSDGSANQTDPANNRAEWGPSDNDIRNRFTGTVLYTTPNVHTGHRLLDQVASGYQASSIVTLHSGFSWTPVVNNNFAEVPNSSVVVEIRPIAYAPGAGLSEIGSSCSNSAFKSGSNFPNRGASGSAGGVNYYSLAQPSATVPYIPVVGRNSLTGPCYRDIDFSVAKQVGLEGFGHTAVLRFQANMYNAFNLLQLQPISNEGFGTNISDINFGKSAGADAGRVIEFLARVQF